MNPAPTFGLLVPCKDGASFLPRLFASARAQTRPFDEIWVYDDGSSDDTARVARTLGAEVLRGATARGPSAARNRLAEACGCDWLHFHDADDTMNSAYLERVSARVNAATDVVICDMLWLDEVTGQIDNRWSYDATALVRHPAAYLLINPVGGINGLYRRSTLAAAGGFDEKLGYWEDLELHLRLNRLGARTAVVNEELVTAHRRRTSYSNSNLGEVWRVKLQLMERLRIDADPELRDTIAREAETIADRLAQLRCWADVPAALALAQRAGGDPPTTRSLPLRGLKRVLPTLWTFRLQRALRTLRSP